MRKQSIGYLNKLKEKYQLPYEIIDKIILSVQFMKTTYQKKGKVLVCGNGGSGADSEHIVGELMKGFKLNRTISPEIINKIESLFPGESEVFKENLQNAIPSISLVSQTGLISAFNNDKDSDYVYAQQVFGYGDANDLLLCLSTSGNSKNIVNAAKIAKVINLKVISLTGQNGGLLKSFSDVLINVPSTITSDIQELHLPIYHVICLILEEELFGDDNL